MFKMTESNFSDAIAAIENLSSPSNAKFNRVRPLIADVFGLRLDEVYVTFIGRAANAQVRMYRQMSQDQPIKVAAGVCGTHGDWTSRSYAVQSIRTFASRPTLNLIFYSWNQGTDDRPAWEPRLCFYRPGSQEFTRFKEMWPEVEAIAVEDPTPGEPPSGSSAKSMELTEMVRRVMELQSSWTSTNTDEMKERGELIRNSIPEVLRSCYSDGEFEEIVALSFEGRDGTGRKTRVPWVRAYSSEFSRSATEGWYVVYLFSFAERTVYLSLNQGTTTFVGKEFKPRDPEVIAARVLQARSSLSGDMADEERLTEVIDLSDPGGDLASGYEAGNVVAFKYDFGDDLNDDLLISDLNLMLSFLGTLYAEEAESAPKSYWLFQGNPERWPEMNDWLAAAELDADDSWTASQHVEEMAEGDLIAFWMSGSEGGICAVGEISGEVYERANSGHSGNSSDTEDAVPYRVTRFLKPLINREACKAHPILKDLSILRFANATNFRITREQWDAIMELISLDSRRLPRKRRSIDPNGLRIAAEAEGLRLNSEVFFSLAAALSSGKHVMLTGAPGTAKTTLAALAAREAADAGWCSGYSLTTATADWTTYETIGGLKPTKDGQLEFAAGHFLEAIRSDNWLVIDELNRANFDRAFGQLFTVLSGQWVALPHKDSVSNLPIAIAPANSADPSGIEFSVTRIPEDWRIIATMNVFDKSLLFEMSFALMRRFAFIEVESPDDATYRGLITSNSVGTHQAAVLDVVSPLLELRKTKDLGPALFIDMARHANSRLALGDIGHEELRFQLFYSYLLPQFEGINDQEGRELHKILRSIVAPSQRDRLRSVLESVLGLQLQVKSPRDSDDADYLDDDEPIDD